MNEENKNQVMTVQEIPVSDIAPNPYQPRLAFDDTKLSSLADSISRYGVMQPIVVTKKPDGSYELISGERRLRASKIAGKETIPAVVRDYEHSDEEKFELAIIENIQREDLSPADKAHAFEKLVNQFGYTHSEIAQKMGKSREYISNSLRLLLLPDEILNEMGKGPLTEGHARPLLMLKDRPYEQGELFKKIINQKLTVRAADKIARSIATEKLRKLDIEKSDPEIKVMEKKLAEKLGTKVHIDEKPVGEGGKLTIEYFSKEDLEKIINLVRGKRLSEAPVLESSKNSQESGDGSIERFQDNFASGDKKEEEKIGEQALKSSAVGSVFASEIESLKNTSDIKTDEEKIKVDFSENNIEEKSSQDDGIDGYNISFGGVPKKEEKTESISSQEQEGENKTSEQIEQEIENFDNFESINNFDTPNWKKQQQEDNYQKELEEMLSQKVDTKKDNIENSQISENLTQKHSITEISLDNKRESFAQSDSQIQAKVEQENQGLTKDSYMASLRNQQEGSIEKNTVPEVKYENSETQNFSEKTEAQKRIDDILAGKKTVAEEYGLKKEESSGIKTETAPVEQNKEEAEEDIDSSSIYQQFLESKKKVEAQKERMFSGNDDNEINNVGSFSETTSEFTNYRDAHTGSYDEKVKELKEEKDIKSVIKDNFETNDSELQEQYDESEVKVENIIGGGDFVPEKPLSSESENQQNSANLESKRKSGNEPDADSKYTFGGFSI